MVAITTANPQSSLRRNHRKQQHERGNVSMSATNRRFLLFFGWFLLAGLHTVVFTTQLQKYYGDDSSNALKESKASFGTTMRQRFQERNPTYRGLEEDVVVAGKGSTFRGLLDLNMLEKAGAQAEAAAQEIRKSIRPLTIDDLELGDYIDHGAINIVARVFLPDWWFEQAQELHNDKSAPIPTPKNSKFVVKLAAGKYRVDSAKRECKALQKLNQNKKKVRELNIMPTLMTTGPCSFSNPYYTDKQKPIPASFPDKYIERLRSEPEIVAIVVPYYDKHYLTRPSKWVDNLDDLRYFIKTLLETLVYAHSLGVNNMDISGSNVKVDKYGRAMVVDWNACQSQGQPIFDDIANTWITAPEGLLEKTGLDDPKEVLQVSISAMDIWSIGVMMVNLVYYPCFFVNPRGLGLHHSQIPEDQERTEFPIHYGLIREMLLRLGGETRIPVGGEVMLDLADLVGLARQEVMKREFDLPLYTNNATCQETNFEMLQGESQIKINEMHSLLQSIFKISPLERPQAKDLLKHPFFAEKAKPLVKKKLTKKNYDEVVYDLSLADMQVGEFIGNGMINIVAFVTFPDWWYRQHKVDKEKQKYVIKMAPGDKWYTSQGDRECDVLEAMNKNATLARKHNVLPNIFCMRRARNPFFRNPTLKLPPTFPFKHEKRLRKEHKMSAVVVPYFDLDHVDDYCDDLDDVKLFISSLLETLEYSHSLGINNFDLSTSNVKISPRGRAVVMDWNANKVNGQDMYDPTANTRITAPEGLLEYGLTPEDRMLQTSISAMDIWSVGTILTDLVFYPCYWISKDDIPMQNPLFKSYDYIREMLLEIGGESLISIGNNKTLDIAALVGLNRNDILKRKFNLPLYDEDGKCKTKEFEMLKDEPKEEVDLVYSFLETSMKIALHERPTASKLLKHPFLATVDSKPKSAKAAKRVEGKTKTELEKIMAGVPMHYLDAAVEENKNTTKPKKRQLTVDDIDIGEFVGNGAINMVAVAFLPDWWYKQHKVNKKTNLYVVKLAAGGEWFWQQGQRECDVLKVLTQDKKRAKELGILKSVLLSGTVPNPFYKGSKHIPSKFPKTMAKTLQNSEKIVAIVQPFMDLDYVHDLKTFHDIRYFIRSLLQILDYAHSLGVNNFDLSDSNVRVDEDGEAVVMDWNANKKQGEDIYDPVANIWITAPEGLIEHGPHGETIRQTSISAMDIWSVGIMMIFLMYQPCQWVNPEVSYRHGTYPRNFHIIKEVVESIGGETRIPIGNNQQLDLAELVGLKREDVRKKKWRMPLWDTELGITCDAEDTEAFLIQYAAKSKELEDMHDFLRSMMKLSPAERPDAATLLKHPFMDFPAN